MQWRFPARNRIIVGLSEVVVVVEAPEKSGALITARHALEAGCDVWTVPGPFSFAECRGSNSLLADGAEVLWKVTGFVEAVVPEKLAPSRLARTQGAYTGAGPLPPGELPETEAAVLRVVGFEPTEVDVVATRSGIGVRELLPALALLELKGYVRRDASGAFSRSPTGGDSGGDPRETH